MKTRKQPNKIVFSTPELGNMYQWQENKYRIPKVTNVKEFYAKKRAFLKTKTGQQFLSYRLKKFKVIQGLDVWLIDGHALRSGARAGDVDFTMGGHAYRYLYIPRYEIWVDKIYKREKDFWPLFWHEYLERSLMMRGKSYLVAHNAASKLEVVLRDGNYFVLPVGTVRQISPGYCGPAALKIVMDFLRHPVSQKYLGKLCKTSLKKGTDPDGIVQAAKQLNFIVNDRQYLTVREVKRILRKGKPIIANLQTDPHFGEGHYVVIIGYSDDEFIFSDPEKATGYVRVSIPEFMSKWYEMEDNTIRQGITLEAP